MTKTKVLFFMAMVFFFCTAGFSFAAGTAKIGIVDFHKIATTSSPGKIVKAEINKKGKEMETTLKKKGMEIDTLKKALERESLVMSNDKLLEKQRNLRIKINDFKQLKAKYARQFKQMEARLLTKVKKDVLDLTRKIGKQEGFTLILEKNESGTMYSLKSMDITDKVIEEYNKTAVKK